MATGKGNTVYETDAIKALKSERKQSMDSINLD